jgi:hypothetical protein
LPGMEFHCNCQNRFAALQPVRIAVGQSTPSYGAQSTIDPHLNDPRNFYERTNLTLFFLSWSRFAGNIDILPPMHPEFLVKLNREFESNPLRQPVSPFLSLGGVLPKNSILPPKTREYRMDKHLTSVSNGQAGWQSACISPRQGRAVEFRKLN